MMKAVASKNIQFVSDESGVPTGVIVPIEEWRRMEAERGDFFRHKTARDLVREQGVKPLMDTHALEGLFSADEDIDEMLDEIYRDRG